jgi:HEAT repeat protein
MKGGTERRKYPRSKPQPGSTLSVYSGEGASDQNVCAKVIDVSAIGACIETRGKLREGSPVRVDLVLPGARGGKFSTRGTIRWAQELQSNGDQAFTAGVEFESVIDALAGKAGESAILDILLTLRVAVAQLRLYPKESPQVLKVVTDSFHSIISFLEGAPTLTLSKTPRGLLINGRPLAGGSTVVESVEASTLALLTESQIKSVTFRKGMALEELLTFLHALTKKFWDVKDGKEINRRLRDERVLQITVDEVTYVALGEGDIVIEDAARKLSGGETELAKLLQNMDQLIETSSQEGMAQEARLSIMKKLLDQDPELLKHVGERPAGGPGGTGTTGGALPADDEGRVALEDARHAIGDIARLLPDLGAGPQAVLRRLGKVLIDAFRHNPQLSAMMGALLQAGAAQTSPAPAQAAPSEPPAVSRATGILSLPDDEKIMALAQEGAALLDELSALERPDLVKTVLDSLAGYLGDRSAKRRLSACRSLSLLRRAHEKNASEETVYALEIGVRSALDQERDATVYPVLADLAGFFADLRIRRGALDRAREIVDLLHKHYKIKDPAFSQRGELAYVALERLAAGAGVASIVEKLRTGEPEAVRIIESIGAAATRFLIGQIRATQDPALRLHYAGFIARAGAGAATALLDEIQKTVSPSDILPLMEMLPHATPPDMAEMALGGLLRHGAVAVRKRSAGMLADQAYPRAGALLLEAFGTDPDGGARIAFIDCIGRIKHKGAVDPLLAMADSRQQVDEVRAAACLALGRIGDPRVIPILSRIALKGERGLTSILAKVAPAVRTAAVRGLALFPGNKDAREAVRRAMDDKEPAIKAAAQQARYAPLYEAFGAAAQGIEMIADVREVPQRVVKVAGSFAELPFEAVCRWIGGQERTGMLVVASGGQQGRIWFDAGLVIAAEFQGRTDKEAFTALAIRREGLFLFEADVHSGERRILIPVDSLLHDTSRGRVAGKSGSDTGLRPPG